MEEKKKTIVKQLNNIVYVEPNYTFEINEEYGANGLNVNESAPPLEDYCIFVNLVVEVRGRKIVVSSSGKDKEKLSMTFTSTPDVTTVNFMQGSTMADGVTNSFTTNYTEPYLGDIKRNGPSTEMFGIKSIDISYNNYMMPQVTIEFVDVRGVAVFAQKELSVSQEKAINEDDENIANTFFQAFFTVPYPKFTLYVKGFYGQPVTYQLLCSDFRAKFESQTGNFNCTATFLGFHFAFLNDAMMNAIVAAPYSDYIGSEYWDAQNFTITGENGGDTKMPKMAHVIQQLKDAAAQVEKLAASSPEVQEKNDLDSKNTSLNEVRAAYAQYMGQVSAGALAKVPKDENGVSYAIHEDDKNGNWKSAIIYSESSNSDSFEKYFNRSTVDEAYKNFKAVIDAYNTDHADMPLPVPQNFADAKPTTRISSKNNDGKYIVDDSSNSDISTNTPNLFELFKQNTNNANVNGTTSDNPSKLSQYTSVYYFHDGGFSDKIAEYLNENDKATEQANENIQKMTDNLIAATLGWVPSVENLTRIVMAHFETFAYMLFKCGMDITNEKRTISSLGIDQEDLSDVKVNSGDEIVPPFPLVTELKKVGGVERRQDSWVGKYSGYFKEKDLVNGILNGVWEVSKELADPASGETAVGGISDAPMTSMVKIPLTPYDIVTKQPVYGRSGEDFNDTSSLLGLVGMRGIGILGLTNYELFGSPKDIGKAEAVNLMDNHNLSKDMKDKLGGLSGNTGDFIKMMKGESSGTIKKPNEDKGPWPWRKDPNANPSGIIKNNGSLIICKDHSYQSFAVPITNLSWSNIWSGCDGNNNPVAHASSDFIDVGNYKETPNPKQNMFTIEMNMNRAKTIITNQTLSGVSSSNAINVAKLVSMATPSQESYSKDYIEDLSSFICYPIEKASEIDYDPKGVTNTCLIPPSSSLAKKDFSYFGQAGDKGYNLNDFHTVQPNELWKYKNGETVRRKGENALDEYLKVFNGSNFHVAEFPGLDSDLEPTKENSIFSNTYYRNESDIHVKALLFLHSLSKLFKYENIIKDIYDDEKPILNIPLPGLLYLCGLCWAHDNLDKVKNEKVKKFFKTYVKKENISPKISLDYNVYQNFKKIFVGWVDGKIDWADSVQIKPFKSFAPSLEVPAAKFVEGEIEDNSGSWLSDYNGYIMNFFKEKCNENFFKNYMTADEDAHSGEMGIRLGNRDGGPGVVPAVNFVLAGCTFIKHTKYFTKKLLGNDIHVDVDDLEEYFEGFLEKVLENYTTGEETTESSAAQGAVDSKGSNDDIRVGVYRYCKLMYDKWIGGIDAGEFNRNYTQKSFFDNSDKYFVFIDTYYLKANNVPMNVQYFADAILKCYGNDQYALLSFLSDQYSHNKFTFNCISNFLDLSDKNAIKDMFDLVPYTKKWNTKEHPTFVVMYCDQPSAHLDVPNSEYPDDGFMVNGESTNLPQPLRSNNYDCYAIPAFGVTYGKQYQSYFTDVSVGMDNPMVTEQSIKAQFQIASAAASEGSNSGDRSNVVYYGQDLYSVYSNNSYTCQVTMMGCAFVQPLMYFCLNNVPMFRGTYLIQRVQHMITPGNMTTTFTGVRMANISTRVVEDYAIRKPSNGNGNGGDGSDAGESISNENIIAGIDNDCPYKVYPLTAGGAEGCIADFAQKVKKWEGGYAGNIDGQICTMKGVTLATFRSHFGANKTCNDLRNITDEQWTTIFKGTFWDDWRADEISNCSIAMLLVDWHWASGYYGIYYPQEVLGLPRSSKVTEKEINAINSYPNQQQLFDKLWKRREQHFRAIATKGDNAKFLKGWLNRLNDFHYSPNAQTAKVANNDDKHIEGCVEGLVNAVNKTSQSSSVKVEIGIDTQKSKGNVAYLTNAHNSNNFGMVFDILLNAYSDKLDEIKWVTAASNQVPKAFICTVNEASKSTKISVVNESNTNTAINISVADGGMHEHFCKAIVKKYQSSSGSVTTDVANISQDTVKALFEKYKMKDCATALNEAGLSPGGGSGPTSGKWIDSVKAMANFYQNNVHTYQAHTDNHAHGTRKSYDCPQLGKKVEDDCSSYVKACLMAYGCENVPYMNTATMNEQSFMKYMADNGFTHLPFSWDTVQPFDIMLGPPSSHTEIYAGDKKSYSWGRIHDVNAGGMPSPTAKSTKYKHIWRKNA